MSDTHTEPTGLSSVHTTSLVEALNVLGCSVVLSTYQVGKLVIVRADEQTVNTHFRNFPQPMGIAYDRGWLAVGTKTGVQEYRNQPAAVARLESPSLHDALFLPRRSHSTGNIAVHEMEYIGDELWIVNTRFSCLCTLERDTSFVPRWRPKFVTELAPDDRCHLNGFAIVERQPKYVTALGATDANADWRERKARGGILLDVPTGEIVSHGLSMPHSPRWYRDRLWLCESGSGALGVVDPASGRFEAVALLPGFTRGLDFFGNLAFVGLSQVRESALFSGIPITDRLRVEERWCGLAVIDIDTGQLVAFLRFEAGVQEVFAVRILPGIRYPDLLNGDEDAIANSFVLPDSAMPDLPRTALP